MRRTIAIALLCAMSFVAGAQESKHFISFFRDTYFSAGIPLQGEINKETADVAFQLSVKVAPFNIGDHWSGWIGYTQKSVWNLFDVSCPFRDNSYMPGLHFEGRFRNDNTLLLGLEHRSNGRPYFGNPRAEDTGVEDYSRSINYVYASWTKQWGPHSLHANAKLGFGCGVGSPEAHNKNFSQDLFLYFLGYATVGYQYEDERFGAFVSVTPIYNKSIANVDAEANWAFAPKWPRLFLHFHYGYDECMCDCVFDSRPRMNLRLGLTFNCPVKYKI